MTAVHTTTTGQPRLSLRSVGDLVDAFDAGVLTAMQDDAARLAAAGGPGAGGWACFAAALGEACAIAEHERQDRS